MDHYRDVNGTCHRHISQPCNCLFMILIDILYDYRLLNTGYTSLSPHPGYPMPEYANGYSTPYSTSAYSCGYSASAYQQGAPPNGFAQNPCYSMPPPQQDKLSVSSKDDRYLRSTNCISLTTHMYHNISICRQTYYTDHGLNSVFRT